MYVQAHIIAPFVLKPKEMFLSFSYMLITMNNVKRISGKFETAFSIQ